MIRHLNDDTNFQGKTFDNILSKSECQSIIDFIEKNNRWDYAGHEFWDNRVLNLQSIKNQNNDISVLLLNVLDKIKQSIVNAYNVDKEIYPDILQVVKWPVGMEQPVHADCCYESGHEHPTPWRIFGAVLYLNDDFEGGETYYPEHDIKISPETGKLALHWADLNHSHGVTKVKGNTRYTVISFWSFDKSKEMKIY